MATLADHEDYSLYSNAFGFLRQPLDFEPSESNADIVITGVPFDLATTGRSGSRMGPQAIRKASMNLAWEPIRWPWDFKLSDQLNMVDCGDLVFDCGDAAQMSQRLESHTRKMLAAGKKVLSFGGDHFVTLPLLRAHAAHYGKLALIHFDAHTDDYDQGGEFDHGTMFHTAQKENLIDPVHSTQIGIRTTFSRNSTRFNVLEADYVNETSTQIILDQIHEKAGKLPIYLTFDVDCLDPAYAPGTGTPVCGGLTTDKALKLIRGLEGLNIVGMDVVEVSPAYDHGEITALAAATVALDMLHLYARLKD